LLCATCRSDRCEGFSGADVAALVKEAAVLALKESMAVLMSAAQQQQQQQQQEPAPAAAFAVSAADAAAGTARPLVYLRHFEAALASVTPSVSRKDRRAYEVMRVRLRGARAHIPAAAAAGSEGTAAAVDPAAAGVGAGSGMDADDGAAAVAATGVGDDMEGVDDAPEPADPMKDD
jgi:ribosome biogenesis ATPase